MKRLLLALFALALLATFASRPGLYVADARFEHFWDASGYLGRHRSLWDDLRTLGRPTLYYSPVVAAFLTLVESVGVPPWAMERLLHAGYLTIAGAGMVEVVRLQRPRIGAAHVVAGLLYTFNPYTSQFLVPSGLFLHYALAPWLVVALARGIREPRRWYWPAVFALAVFSLGSLNAASLGYALLPLLPLAAHLLAVERSSTVRAAAQWSLRAGLLTLGCCATALVVVRASAPVIAQNLATTELPEVVSSRSSWTESLRGLGSWLSYLVTSGGPIKPQAAAFLDAPLVIAATFVVPAAAVVGLACRRIASRSLYGMWIVVGLVAMVHLFPVGDPPPLGRALRTLYAEELALRGFRDGYKAGATLMLGVSALAAFVVADVLPATVRRIRGVHLGRVAAGAVAFAAVISAFPFWTGELYNETEGTEAIPQYWDDALAWLDAQPDEGTVMVLPGFGRTRYRWGYVGDDIIDARLERRHVARWSLPNATAETADLLEVLDQVATGSSYRRGTLAPMAERLGIRWIVIRNDTDWQRLQGPRPLDLAQVRRDPDLELVARFGAPGEHVVADGGRAHPIEARLPPVEIYEVPSVVGGARTDPERVPELVSGDGAGIAALAADGSLDRMGPFAYTASTDDDHLVDALRAGSPVRVTDTNRRRITQVRTTRNQQTRTLFERERTDRPPIDLFGRAGSQSVLVPAPEAAVIAPGDTRRAFSRNGRSGFAFDGVDDSAWQVEQPGEALTISFTEPTSVGQLEIDANETIRSIAVAVDQTLPVTVRVPRRGTVRIDIGRDVSLLRISIGRLSSDADAPPAEVSEIRVDDRDLGDFVQVPDDLWRRAQGDDAIADALADAPLLIHLDRVEEATIRRRVWSDTERAFRLELRGRAGLRDELGGDGCRPALRIDTVPVPVRAVDGTHFESCEPVVLDAGWHEVVSDPGLAGLVDGIDLEDVRFLPAPQQDTFAVATTPDQRPTSRDHQVERAGWLVLDEAFDPGWVADVDGEIVAPRALDTMNAWWIPGPASASTWYRPQQYYDLTIMVTGASVALALCIVGRRLLHRRREVDRAPG